MRKGIYLLILLLISGSLMGAANKKCSKKCNKKASSSTEIKKNKKLESWYIQLGLGSANIKYSDDTRPDFRLNDGVWDRESVFLDIGVYIPLNKRFLLGTALSVDSDHFELDGGSWGNYSNPDWEDWNSMLISVSGMYFFNRINKGFFVRGDLGISKVIYENSWEDKKETKSDQNNLGYRIAGGYALNIGPSWSLLLSAGYSFKSIENYEIKTTNLFVSILF